MPEQDERNSGERCRELEPYWEVLDDAAEAWSEAAQAYHEPALFRRRLGELIQLLRNSTFRLQSLKGEFDDFDTWYAEWQAFFAESMLMRWLNTARVEIVKRSGLAAASRAIVIAYSSYLEPPAFLLSVPATADTERFVDGVRAQIPVEVQPHVALEVSRRWEVAELPGRELLEALRECHAILRALGECACARLVDRVEFGAPSEWIHPYLLQVRELPDPSASSLLFAADTGEVLRFVGEPVNRDETTVAAARKRYGGEKIAPDAPFEEYAQLLHNQARNVFKKDGVHYPFLYLHHPDNGWELVSPMADDKREKFVIWNRLGSYVASRGHDALVFTSEVWFAALQPDEVEPYQSLEGHPGVLELLVTQLETRSGVFMTWSAEIVRFMGKAFLKRSGTQTATLDSSTEPGFTSPIRRAWGVQWQPPS